MKLYIAIHPDCPDEFVPVAAAHAATAAYINSQSGAFGEGMKQQYQIWESTSFRKFVGLVDNQKHFEKIRTLPGCMPVITESRLDGVEVALAILTYPDETPSALRFLKPWKPRSDRV